MGAAFEFRAHIGIEHVCRIAKHDFVVFQNEPDHIEVGEIAITAFWPNAVANQRIDGPVEHGLEFRVRRTKQVLAVEVLESKRVLFLQGVAFAEKYGQRQFGDFLAHAIGQIFVRRSEYDSDVGRS